MAKGTPSEGINGTLANGLIAHYSFNDGSLSDLSGNGKHLIANGTVDYAADKDGQANQAIGANSFLGLNEKLFLNTANEPFAYSIWFKKNTVNDLQVLIGNGTYQRGGCYTQIQERSLMVMADSSAITVISQNLLQEYNCLIVSYDGAKLKYKLNNNVTGEKSISITSPGTGYDKFAVGCYTNRRYYPFKSSFDEIRVYNRSLTDLEMQEIFIMGVNYINNVKPKVSEIIFNIDFDKVQLGTYININDLDIKANGVSILDKTPIVKYWTNDDKTVRVFYKEGETFEDSTDLYFQIECDGYETSDVIHKELKIINIPGFQGSYNGGVIGYANHTNDNYKTTEARILIPLTNTSFISYKK